MRQTDFSDMLGLSTQDKSVKVFQKDCKKCGVTYKQDKFRKTKSLFFPDGYCDICDDCLELFFGDYQDLSKADKFCQYIDIGFDANDWINDVELNNAHYAFKTYCEKYWSKKNGDEIDWKTVHDEWKKAMRENAVEDKLDFAQEEKVKELRVKWGETFSVNELLRLEELYNEIDRTQSVVTAIQKDNAKKMCLLSLKVDAAIISDNEDDTNKVKAYIAAYNDLAKAADFTPKSAKNLGDFESFGEVARWIEKKGYMTNYYAFENKDEIDFMMHDIQQYLRRIVIGESNIKDELNDKLDQVQRLAELERSGSFEDLDYRENVQLDDSIADEFNEEFDTGGDE